MKPISVGVLREKMGSEIWLRDEEEEDLRPIFIFKKIKKIRLIEKILNSFILIKYIYRLMFIKLLSLRRI